ncbi:hypothetical protein [Rhodococcus jostii]|uniref:hypothetical protein n=1 Tax=Rhodococcus jostii TaxID=132919 RepID=UPI00363D00BC
MTTSRKRSRLHRMRRLVYTPLVAAVAAGTVCAGAGISTAATDADPGPVEWIDWRVHNYTDQVLTSGSFYKEDLGRGESEIDVTGLTRGQYWTGMYAAGEWANMNLTSARNVCYNHTAWSMDRLPTPYARWRDVYVFVSGGQLFITPEGAYENWFLDPTGAC